MEPRDTYHGIICKIEIIQGRDILRTAREPACLHGVQEVGGSNPLAPTRGRLQLKTMEELRELHGEELKAYLLSLPVEDRWKVLEELLMVRMELDA
jgi:hypothetical protein